MNDFDYDVLQKKRIARGAYHLKRGSRSRKVTLPSDNLTAKQRERMNGQVETYNMGKPMTFAEFIAMPSELQDEYITGLRVRFNANQSMLGEMLGVSGATLSRHMKDIGSPWGSNKGCKNATWQDKIAFAEWCGEEAAQGIPDEEAEAVAAIPVITPRAEPQLLAGSFTLAGNMADIASKLVATLGVKQEYRVTIQFEVEAEDNGESCGRLHQAQ